MTERKPLSISVDMNTDKLQLKLQAIAKHAEALADELDAIDKGIRCCDCESYNVYPMMGEYFRCNNCETSFHISNALTDDDELPTRLEGSD